MKKIFYLFCVSVLLAGCGSKDNASNKLQAKEVASKDFLEEGVRNLSKGDPADAIKNFQKAIQDDPTNSKAYFILAETYMRMKNYTGAIKSLEATTRLDSVNGKAYLLLGVCFNLAGDHEQAISSVKKSAALFKSQKDVKSYRRALATLKRLSETTNPAASQENAGTGDSG